MHESANTEGTLAFLGAATHRLRQMLGGASEAELRRRGALCSWSEFCAATSPPETIGQAFGRMLLNVHGMSAPTAACAVRHALRHEVGWG